MKTMKKIVAILAVALLLCSTLPMAVFAAEDVTIAIAGTTGVQTSDNLSISWTSGNYSVVNNKASSTTAIRVSDSDHYRIYAKSQLVVSGGSMSQVAITCTSSSYATALKNSTVSGWTASASDSVVTYTPNGGAADELSITIGAQVRAKTVVITPAASTEPEEPSTCEHVWVDANCTTAKTCSACGATDGEALGHSYGEATETVAPDCTNAGEQQSTCSVCGDVKTETVKALGHTYVDGFCSVCNEAEPNEVKYTFSDYTAGTQYAKDEVHKLDDIVTVTTTDCHFTTQLRIYSSSTNNGYAVITSTKPIVGITLNAGNKVDTLNLLSESGEKLATISVTATSYNDYTVEIPGGTKYIKLDVEGTQQIRIASMTLQFASEVPSACEHDYVGVETQAPTCAAEGVMTYTCSKCEDSYTEAIATIPHNYGEGVETQAPDCTNAGVKTYTCPDCGDVKTEEIPANGHNYVNDVCDVCGAEKAYKGTITFDADKTQRTEYSTEIQVWENEGLTFTNNKLTGNNVGDYTNPVRLYKNSGIVIEFSEMVKLIIDASGINSDYLWDATLEAAGLSFTVENKIYTITFDETVNSVELTAANQVRANSITAIAAHECAWVDATCTAPKTCSKCGATEGEALGHSYFYPCDIVCQVCYEETNPDATHNIVAVEAVDATCTENGNIAYWYCSDCGAAWADEALTQITNRFNVIVPATGEHTYDHSEDTECNDCGAIRPVDYMLSNFGGNSVSEDVNGLAFQYTMEISGIQVKEGTTNEADFTNATAVINSVSEPVKVLGMGAIVSNDYSPTLVDYVDGKHVIDIPAVYMTDLEADTATFAVRVINIPDTGKDTDISVRPYLIYEDQFGNVIRWYGLEDWTSYNQVAG